MTPRSPATKLLGILAVIVLLGVLLVAGLGVFGGGSGDAPTVQPTDPRSSAASFEAGSPGATDAPPGASDAPSSASATAPGTPAPTPPDGMEAIERSDLPPEALETLALIDAGGPYPYRQDDSTFQNREGLLPDRPTDHYREYTVETPGSADRGARRIVAGADGERYWTDDHYDSFRWIAP